MHYSCVLLIEESTPRHWGHVNVPIKVKGKPLYGLFSTDFAENACTSFESQPDR
jgi:hypothetical protein